MAKKGFTLVELSVVLVIIGLLIGGILVGRSMISSAKITSFVKQIQQSDAAVATFKSKYKSLPGNTTHFSPAGSGSGYINCPVLNCANNQWYGPGPVESYNFWYHLSLSGELTQQYKNDAQVKAGVDDPASALNPNVAIVALGHINNWVGGFDPIGQYTAPINIYMLMGNESGGWANGAGSWDVYTWSTTPSIGEPIDCPTAAAVDSKMDDGMPNTGNVVVVYAIAAAIPANSNTGYVNCNNGTNDTASQPYVFPSGGSTSIAIPILSQTVGGPK